MRRMNSQKGQSVLEYAILVVVVVGALLAMQWYMKGGYQGRLRSASDDIGEQFSPTRTQGSSRTVMRSNTVERAGGGSFASGAMSSSTSIFDQTQTRTENESLEGLAPIADQR